MSRFLPLLCLALCASPSFASTYSIVDLGTLGGPASQAHGVNAQGWVVGESMTASGADHAFLYRDGKMTDLGVGGSISVARSVNEAGQVVGDFYGDRYHGFLSSGGKVSDVGTLGAPYTFTYSINALGHAVGSSYGRDGRQHAFFWDGQSMTDLGTLGGTFAVARGVNAKDLVVGNAYLRSGKYHAFAGTKAGLVDLGTLGGDYSGAQAVNDAGQIAGYAYSDGNTKQHACLWLDGVAHDLGGLDGSYSEALALDGNASHVVGRATVPTTTGAVSYHAFLWSEGALRDLNTLVSAGSGWVLEEATGINDAGQIVGSGTYNGQRHAFLLQPNTPVAAGANLPGSLSLAAPYPNPARDAATFEYALPRAGQVSIRILDVSGRLVRDLVRDSEPAGAGQARWDLKDGAGRAVGTGVYFAELRLDQESRTSQVRVLR